MTEDNYHKIALEFTTDSSFRILEITPLMEKVPFESCRKALPGLEKLVGLRIFDGGVLKEINKIIPRNKGCTHLYEMLESAFRALFAASAKKYHDIEKNPGQLAKNYPALMDRCICFKSE